MNIRLPTQANPPLSPRQSLPTMYDLPTDNPEEPGLPDEFHFFQPLLLFLTFQPGNWSADEVFSACDLNLYYDVNHTNWYKRPDWFGVVGIPRLYERRDLRLSYVVWQEEISPFVVVELLSPGTEDEDFGRTVQQQGNPPTKWQVYEQILRVPYYVIFSRYSQELQVFHLVDGKYERVNLTEGRLVIPELELSLGVWYGSFRGIERLWLRWMTLSGELIATDSEEVIVAREEARLAQELALQEAERAQKLAQRLRELGIDPDTVS